MRSVAFIALLAGCTTLGPVPATTGVSAVPTGSTAVEMQAGIAPAFLLSSAATRSQQGGGDATPTVGAHLEPGPELGVPGLIVGARAFGRNGDSPVEPYLGYRRRLTNEIAVAAIGFGTHTTATDQQENSLEHASYSATHAGLELAADAQLLEITSWLAVHVQATVQATALWASGTYCVDATGDAEDCQNGAAMVDGTVHGIYPSATATFAVQLGHYAGVFETARIAITGAAGRMPALRDGDQVSGNTYVSGGLSLTLGLGGK